MESVAYYEGAMESFQAEAAKCQRSAHLIKSNVPQFTGLLADYRDSRRQIETLERTIEELRRAANQQGSPPGLCAARPFENEATPGYRPLGKDRGSL